MQNLPQLPADPIAMQSAWLSLTFVIGVAVVAAGLIVAAFKLRQRIEIMIRSAQGELIGAMASLEIETKDQLVKLNESSAEMVLSLHQLTAHGEATRERMDDLERRVAHLDDRTERTGETVARIQGRLNGADSDRKMVE